MSRQMIICVEKILNLHKHSKCLIKNYGLISVTYKQAPTKTRLLIRVFCFYNDFGNLL